MSAAGLASFLVGSGNRRHGDEEHRSREHPRVKCCSEVFGLGLSDWACLRLTLAWVTAAGLVRSF